MFLLSGVISALISAVTLGGVVVSVSGTVALEVVIHISAVTPVAVTYHVSLQQFVPHHVSR